MSGTVKTISLFVNMRYLGPNN